MNTMQQHLTDQLTTALSPMHLEVINESNNHSGPATESHFKLVVVSDYFADLKLIDRHRFINQLFKEELNHIHALAMHTYTPNEWQMKNGAPNSPQCAGGSKF
ncbi:Cell division protein BolA [Bathymodiolus thermophilus thioautotrophic gill symbiont]|uniref:Cell division protein BolA n=1 Tax=Bathymodiolus thermophilus thioautotrophic gill symbiont TaxID=2360 RepID=A0A3G3IKP2_9GAMM|nr:BolA family protein [Bathymodiolus thermophilus thioautotrophic gill symbiont]AYQ56309.1 Cell division protein BolA [Bathymodiolus thermophilus thioautotrophic gill symbiont]CAB5501974.1 Cell division protein BolA [Bathymodiolus thermophilus thioautotrophic gill symbiont]CAB5506411.1 Cell division protein BolA [Bathymodiolus thermophilus thioautotrophic gill symbiont]SGZ87971.1 Cell division protein BolA [Bathymodiolus thermophilus thioautotrophic gill symbiont]